MKPLHGQKGSYLLRLAPGPTNSSDGRDSTIIVTCPQTALSPAGAILASWCGISAVRLSTCGWWENLGDPT